MHGALVGQSVVSTARTPDVTPRCLRACLARPDGIAGRGPEARVATPPPSHPGRILLPVLTHVLQVSPSAQLSDSQGQSARAEHLRLCRASPRPRSLLDTGGPASPPGVGGPHATALATHRGRLPINHPLRGTEAPSVLPGRGGAHHSKSTARARRNPCGRWARGWGTCPGGGGSRAAGVPPPAPAAAPASPPARQHRRSDSTPQRSATGGCRGAPPPPARGRAQHRRKRGDRRPPRAPTPTLSAVRRRPGGRRERVLRVNPPPSPPSVRVRRLPPRPGPLPPPLVHACGSWCGSLLLLSLSNPPSLPSPAVVRGTPMPTTSAAAAA